jgi:hypothetical protein
MNKEVSTYRLNCRPGDLAIVVRSVAGNEGLILTCIELLPRGTDDIDEKWGPVWLVDRPVKGIMKNKQGEVIHTVYGPYMPDSQMCPLRGDLTEDEVQREMEAV